MISCWPTTPGPIHQISSTVPDGNVYLLRLLNKQACPYKHRKRPFGNRTKRPHLQGELQDSTLVQVDLRQENRQSLVEFIFTNDGCPPFAKAFLQERGGNPAVHESVAKIAFGKSG